MLFTQEGLEKFAASVLDPEQKVVLSCGKHFHTYRDKKPPVFACRDCWMVEFVGLLCNTPKERWDEVIEMLEFSIHHMVEQEERGELQKQEFLRHPEVSFTKGN